jgi:DNA helicase MCM8
LNDLNAGKMPKTIDCELKDDLIDKCTSGVVVTICGILKTEVASEKGGGKGTATNSIHSAYIEINSLATNKVT